MEIQNITVDLIKNNNIDELKIILEENSINLSDPYNSQGDTYLSDAIFFNSIEIAQELISRLSEEDLKRNYHSETYLKYSIKKHRNEISELLISKLDVEYLSKKFDDNDTYLTYAIYQNNRFVIDLLFERLNTPGKNFKEVLFINSKLTNNDYKFLIAENLIDRTVDGHIISTFTELIMNNTSFYISGHGDLTEDEFFIIPDNIFIVFSIGAGKNSKDSNIKKYVHNLDSLIEGETSLKEIYKTGLEYNINKFYSPGSVIQNHNINFDLSWESKYYTYNYRTWSYSGIINSCNYDKVLYNESTREIINANRHLIYDFYYNFIQWGDYISDEDFTKNIYEYVDNFIKKGFYKESNEEEDSYIKYVFNILVCLQGTRLEPIDEYFVIEKDQIKSVRDKESGKVDEYLKQLFKKYIEIRNTIYSQITYFKNIKEFQGQVLRRDDNNTSFIKNILMEYHDDIFYPKFSSNFNLTTTLLEIVKKTKLKFPNEKVLLIVNTCRSTNINYDEEIKKCIPILEKYPGLQRTLSFSKNTVNDGFNFNKEIYDNYQRQSSSVNSKIEEAIESYGVLNLDDICSFEKELINYNIKKKYLKYKNKYLNLN